MWGQIIKQFCEVELTQVGEVELNNRWSRIKQFGLVEITNLGE